MRRVIALLAVLAIGLAAPLHAAPYQEFFHETWHDFAEELETARNEGKHGIFLFFEMDDCPFCAYMKENILGDPELQAFYRENFRNFMVDVEGAIEVVDFQGNSMTEAEFALNNYRVRATPVLGFINLDGEMIHRHTGRTSGVDELLLMGQYVIDGLYKEMPFSRYRRQQGE